MSRVAKLLPIPRRCDAGGIQRYGFTTCLYAYRMEELERAAGVAAAPRCRLFAPAKNCTLQKRP